MPVYVRFNRRRSAAYQLKTEVFGCSGKKDARVRKTALTKDAGPHVEAFRDRYELLRRTMNGAVYILPPDTGHTADGRAYAEFPFVEGQDLGKVLAEKIREGKAPVREIRDSLALLLGDDSKECHNLDALFENIMVRETQEGPQYVLLDYEWVSPEPYRRRFVYWRILSYWYDAYRQQLYAYADRQAFLKEFGIMPEETDALEAEEAAFQAKVRGSEEDPADKFRKPHKTPADILFFFLPGIIHTK